MNRIYHLPNKSYLLDQIAQDFFFATWIWLKKNMGTLPFDRNGEIKLNLIVDFEMKYIMNLEAACWFYHNAYYKLY